MKIEQIYTNCLAHAAYYIESNGEAAVFDPLREVQPYMDMAKNDNATIKFVFETHFHADFVSGHLDLKNKTGADIVYGPNATPGFDAIVAEDHQIFEVGQYKIKVIHTPGHTMESTTYLLIDENNKEHGIITGDTLFIGDVGRPDLAQHVVSDLTEDKLARHLYHSLRTKILPLSDNLIVYPNHGAGSACGKMMSKETTDTLGNQKKVNYALQDMTEDEFVKALLDGLTTPPGYFPQNVIMNKSGYESLDVVIKRGTQALDVIAFDALAQKTETLILDTRDADSFSKGFIPNSLNIGLAGNFAQWVGEIIPSVKQQILLVTASHQEEEAITRLARVGYDNTIGFLKGGFEAWKNANQPIETINRIDASTFETTYINKPLVIDVRKKSEFDSEHVIDAKNLPLNKLSQHLEDIPKQTPFIVHCAGGYRSMIAASILKQNGFNDFVDVSNGYKGIAQTSVSTTEYVCPTTML